MKLSRKEAIMQCFLNEKGKQELKDFLIANHKDESLCQSFKDGEDKYFVHWVLEVENNYQHTGFPYLELSSRDSVWGRTQVLDISDGGFELIPDESDNFDNDK